MQSENNVIVPCIITTRVFNYKREEVFRAWSDPQMLKQWWGPNGFTNTIHEFDFNENGTWKLTMHGPDGTDYFNINCFTEITVPEKIVFKHLEPVHTFTAKAFFDEAGENTLLIFNMHFDLLSEYEKLKDFIAAANEENFDRLEKVLLQQK